MVKSDFDSKSDGLEILSIGALYTGPWDKKYWSSSRGKDRYPYPIGYQALRTHNGLTYKMEIHEGSKGPIFQITSKDKQFGSGETPDRAWENFQKKCLTRIKLWHGKRSSGKIDGVEFFGFKNALVQRLLRELVATVNDASDQSSVLTNCNEASPKVHDTECLVTHKYPDLRSCLEKTIVTGKRSRTSRGIDTKLACKSGHERWQPPHLGNDTKALYSASGKMDIDEPLISCALSDHHDKGALQVTSNMELGDNVLLLAHGLPVKSHEVPGDPKTESCLIQVQSEPPIMETSVAASSLGVDMPQEEKPLDRQCIEVQGVGLPVATEERSQMVQVIPDLLKPRSPLLRDSQVSHAGDLFAPDSSDTQQEIACAPNSGSYSGEQAIARNEPVGEMAFSEEAIMGSHSEEGSYLNGNSEKSDFDSVDDDIAKSMMALLVPLAVPLLTYSSRKRRKTKRHKNLPSADFKSSGIIHDDDLVDFAAGTVAGSGSNGQTKAHLSSAIDSGLSMMQDLRYVVPDSVETDQYEDHVANELPPSDNAETVAAHLQKEKQEPDKRGSSPVLDATNFSSHHNGITGIKENLRYVVPDSVENDLYEEHEDNELPPSNNAEVSAAYLPKEKQEPDKRGSSLVLDANKLSSHQNENSKFKDEAEIHPSCLNKWELNDGIEGRSKLIGCYSHPIRISSVMLTRIPQEIYICVSCGLLEEKRRDLFLYKLSTAEPSSGSPFMVGHTSMSLPSLKDEFGREVAVDKFGLQFTPDASGLVLADSIRVPYCREKNLYCLCPECETFCFEENAVKIVQIKFGYVSLVVKLKTIFSVHCLIVCEPDRLIAVDESGRIYIWIMNSTWSEQTDVYVIPSYDFLPSRIVELKRIPKSASMVVGHNGYGEFSLWDIIKRTLVSQFSVSASSVIDFLPVSLFKYPSKGLSNDKVVMEDCVRKLKEATMLWFSRHDVANISCSMEGEDTAIWLLICTSSDTHAKTSCSASNHRLNLDGCWRLGLLMKNMVTLGAALNSSITAIGTSSGTGIIGTQEGQVYTWELATGRKLEALHDLEGKEVLHIATDESTSSVVAVAGDGGQLCVYLRS